MNNTHWKIGGIAGFGILTSGLTFSKIVSSQGQSVFDYVEYPSLIRGGHNAYEVIFGPDKVYGSQAHIDFLICLNQDTHEFNKKNLDEQSVIVYDGDEFHPHGSGIKVDVPFKKILRELHGEGVMRNIIALGASMALLRLDINLLFTQIETQFASKGSEVIAFNKQFAQIGYEAVVKKYSDAIKPQKFVSKTKSPQIMITGNDAFALGAVIADCRLYAAYPMTPSSTVLTTLASWQKKAQIVARHGEDEISVINTALGSAFAGVRSAVGTSGGGFALMVETISLLGVAEIPLVIFLSQRPGPATGMPTWTEQGDLLFAVHAGHGEFPKIVLSPGDPYEMITLTTLAFDLADIYQVPVIVMSDMALSENHSSVKEEDITQFINSYTVDRGKIKTQVRGPYERYSNSADGISEMLIPGQKGHFYQANSYEHTEDGHTTEDAHVRKQQVDKRNSKTLTYLKNHFLPPAIYGDKKSDVVFVCWGSAKGPVLAALELLKNKGISASSLHFTHLFPLDSKKIKQLFHENKRYILVENNSQGQLGKLLQQEACITIEERLLKYDGRPLLAEEIANYIQNS